MGNNIAERLVELRKQKGQNRKEVSACTGIPYPTLNCYERGERIPRQEQLLILAQYYGVTVDELLGAAKPEEPKAEIDQDAVIQMLKDIGLISADRTPTPADIRFLQSIAKQIQFWFD